MKIRYLGMASGLALAAAFSSPAFAQVSEAGPGSADDNITVTDVLNGNNLSTNDQDQDNDYNGSMNSNDLSSADQDNDYNGDNRDNQNESYGGGSASRGGEVDNSTDDDENGSYNGNDLSNNDQDQDNDYNGDNRDNQNESYGGGSASRGGTVDNSTDDDGNGSYNGNDFSNNDQDQDNDYNGDNRDNDSSTNNYTTIAASQVLSAVASGDGLDARTRDDATGGYASGNNSISDAAFANFAGILNSAANTGSSSNSQAGTNIAAQGTVSFGS